MNTSKWMAMLLGIFCCVGIANAQVGQDLKNAGHDTGDAAKTAGHDTAHTTKHIAHRTGHITSRAAHKTSTGTRNIGRRVEGKQPVPNNPQ